MSLQKLLDGIQSCAAELREPVGTRCKLLVHDFATQPGTEWSA